MANNDLLKTILAIGSGIAIGMYLNSDSGRVKRKELANKATEIKDVIEDKAINALDTVKETTTSAIEKTSEFIKDKAATVATKTDKVADTSQSKFKSGIEKAKRQIENGIA